MLPLRHIHNRKYGKNHSHGKKLKYGWIDYLVILISIVGPVFALPQLLLVWGNQNAEGLSIVTWGSYTVFSLIWLVYGYIHHEKPILFSNIVWAFVNFSVFVG